MKTVHVITTALFWGWFVPVMAAPPNVGLPATQSRAEKPRTIDDPASPLPINHIRGIDRIETSLGSSFTKQVSIDASRTSGKQVEGSHEKLRRELKQQKARNAVLPAPQTSVPKSLLNDDADAKLLPNRQVAPGFSSPAGSARGLSKQALDSPLLHENDKIAPAQPALEKRDLR